MKKEIVIAFILVLISLPLCLCLGITPPKQYAIFQPGLELEYNFNVLASPEQVIELYAKGEFSDLVIFDKKELIGGGGFNVKIKLPNEIKIPGIHKIYIAAGEKVGESGAVGTSVVIQAPIIIFVPYPGKYADINFRQNNANLGEEIKFEIETSSMGEEPILATAAIDIYSDENKIDSFNLGTRTIEPQGTYIFVKIINSSIDKPGNYKSTAAVDYQAGTAKAESFFRIGQLMINITNFSREAIKGGIKPFKIDVESLWNNPIYNVFAEVYILKNNKTIIDFLTPSVSLSPWEKKTITGYFDTEKLGTGEYETKIVLNYADKKTLDNGKLEIKSPAGYMIYIIIGIILLVVLVYIFFRFGIARFKKTKSRKNEK